MKKSLFIFFLAALTLTACRQTDNRPVLQPTDIQSGVWTNCPEYNDSTTQGVMMLVSEHSISFATFDFVEGLISDFRQQDAPRYSIREDGTLVCHVSILDRDVRFAYIGEDYIGWWNVAYNLSENPIPPLPLSDPPTMWNKVLADMGLYMGLFSLAIAILGTAQLAPASAANAQKVLDLCRAILASIKLLEKEINDLNEKMKQSLRQLELALSETAPILEATERYSRLHYLQQTVDAVHSELEPLYYASVGYSLAVDSIVLANMNSDSSYLWELDRILTEWSGGGITRVEETKHAMDRLITTRAMGYNLAVRTGMPEIYYEYCKTNNGWLKPAVANIVGLYCEDYTYITPAWYLSLIYCDVKEALYKSDSTLLSSYREDLRSLGEQMLKMYDTEPYKAFFESGRQQCIIPHSEFELESMDLFLVDFNNLTYWDNDNGGRVYNILPGTDPGVVRAKLLTKQEAQAIADFYPQYSDSTMFSILCTEGGLDPKNTRDTKKTPLILLKENVTTDKTKAWGSGVLDFYHRKSNDMYPINDKKYQWYAIQINRKKK